MVDLGKKQNRGAFKKRAHRPWKSSLLEQTIEETAIELESSLFEFDIDLDLDLEQNQGSDAFYPESDFSEAIITAPVTKPEITTAIEPKSELTVMPTEEKAEETDTQITNKLLLGGFFKTQQRISQTNLEASRKINTLLTDLKKREHNTEANEARVRLAIEQSDIISEQFHTAMEQAKQAALAHEEEAELRRAAELQVKKAQLQTNNAQIELQNERQLRMAAEQQTQQALTVAEAAEDLKQQLHDAIDQLMHAELERNSIEQRRSEIQEQYETLNKKFLAIEDEHLQCYERISDLESQGNKVTEADAQRDKLKTIIKAEQELRKIAEQQLSELTQQSTELAQRAEKAEKAWQLEIQQRKLIEERAELAVAHANNTIMHLVNGPVDQQAIAPAVKPEAIEAYHYEPDDLNY